MTALDGKKHDVSGEKRDADGKWAKLTDGLAPEAAAHLIQLAGVAEAVIAYKEKGTLAPKFIDWFGDWVNDKPRASKVLGADGKPAKNKPTHSVVEVGGKPVVVYHGTATGGFESFDKARQDPQSLFGPGFYFTQAEDVAGSYKDKGMEITHLSRNATLADVKKVRAWLSDQANSKSGAREAWYSNLLAHTESTYDLGLILGRSSLVSSKLRTMLGIELVSADNNQEVKHVYLNIRNPIDMDKELKPEMVSSMLSSLRKRGYTVTETRPRSNIVYEIKHRKDDSASNSFSMSVGQSAHSVYDNAAGYFRGLVLDTNPMGKPDILGMLMTTEFLKDAGFDGITHTGGIIHGTKKHKVWIAFEPNQIKAVDNDGEFDPATDNIYKGVALDAFKAGDRVSIRGQIGTVTAWGKDSEDATVKYDDGFESTMSKKALAYQGTKPPVSGQYHYEMQLRPFSLQAIPQSAVNPVFTGGARVSGDFGRFHTDEPLTKSDLDHFSIKPIDSAAGLPSSEKRVPKGEPNGGEWAKGVALSKSAHDVSGEKRGTDGKWVRGSGIPRVPPAELAKTYSDAVQSKAFKAWFGDWDTGEGSKVKGKDGKPAVNTHTHSVVEEGGVPVTVFHGTAHGGFRAFDKSKLDPASLWGAGFYFTQDKGVAESYQLKDGPGWSWKPLFPRGVMQAEVAKRIQLIVPTEANKLSVEDAQKLKRMLMSHVLDWSDEPMVFGGFGVDIADLFERYNPGETKKAFLNIRNPIDIDQPIGMDGLKAIAEAWNAGGEKTPMGVPAAHFIAQTDGSYPILSLWQQGSDGASSITEHFKGADIIDEAANLTPWPSTATDTLKHMGFDGITHIGGDQMGGGNSHRVWIAWEPNQIKAVENEGTFDPANEDMYKGAKAIVIANCPPLTKGVPLEAEKQEHLASTPSGQLPAGQDAYAAMDLRLQQEMARCAMQYDGAREELATAHKGLQPQLKKAVALMEKLRKPVEVMLSGKGPGLTPPVAKACIAYLEAGAEVAKIKMAMRQSYPATVKPGEEKLGGVPGDGPVPDPEPDKLSKAAVAEARVPAGSPGGGRWTDGVLPIAGLEKYGKAKKPVNRKAFDPEVQYHPVTDEHFIKNDPRMILYHGDSRGGAVAPTQYDIYGASTGQASKDTHLDDIRGFYTAPQHNYAMRFTLRFSAKPGGGISAWRLDPSARIADEVELTTQFMGDEDFGHYTKLGHGSLLASLGLYAKDKGYDAILRRDDGADTDEYNPSHPPMSDAEVIVLNQSHLIPVGPGEAGIDMGPAPKRVMQGDLLNGDIKWEDVPLSPATDAPEKPLYPDIPNALKGAQVLILDPSGEWSRVARRLLRKGVEGEGEKGDYVLAVASHPGSAKGQSVRGMSSEHNRTLHNIGYNSATKRIRTLDNLGIDHEVTDHLGHSTTSQWGLEPNMHIKLKGVTHENAQRVGAMFGKAFKQDGIGIAHTGTAATEGNHHSVLGVNKADGSAYSLDEVHRAGEHAGRHGVSVETSEDHKRLDFHHYGGDKDAWKKGVRSTLHTAGMDGPQHEAAESAVSGEYLDKKDYGAMLWGHSKVGGTRQPGAFVHAAQSLARSHTAALGGRSFGQHRPAGPHIPVVHHPGPATMSGRY